VVDRQKLEPITTLGLGERASDLAIHPRPDHRVDHRQRHYAERLDNHAKLWIGFGEANDRIHSYVTNRSDLDADTDAAALARSAWTPEAIVDEIASPQSIGGQDSCAFLKL
jgi:hypothetical protein